MEHYNYSIDDSGKTFVFITKHNIVYRVTLVEDVILSSVSNVEIPNVFTYNVDKITNQVEPLDIKVSATVSIILKGFLTNVENSVLYVCSSADNKERQRYLTFDRWYNNSEFKNNIDKLDQVIYDNPTAYISILYHKNHPLKYKIKEAFEFIEKTANEEK